MIDPNCPAAVRNLIINELRSIPAHIKLSTTAVFATNLASNADEEVTADADRL
jgi:hypothetical protein